MAKRIFAIGFIYVCTVFAWTILGTTVSLRTNSLDPLLKGDVASLWGAPQQQTPPQAWYSVSETKKDTTVVDGKVVVNTKDIQRSIQLPLQKTRAQANLHLDYRKKGLLWYSTYVVQFSGAYDFTNDTDEPQLVTFALNFPTAQAIYDDVVFSVNGTALATQSANTQTSGTWTLQPHQSATLQVGYHSQGLESWTYNFGDQVNQVKDFELRVATNFANFDFPENTLSPTQEERAPSGATLVWSYKNLISGYKIGVAMPQRLQPGPITARISFFAPVCLLFFFFVLFVLTTMRGIELHPMNYFFLACAFFAFHLFMAYLVDHISIHLAFAICSAVSIFLVVSYLRLVVGIRFAAVEAGIAQLIYLVLFSYAFFFEGFTGLSIAIGAILTLFVVMQVTGRIRWSEYFAASRPTSQLSR
jgi:inner membrane protein involved in colicin E2 resistance